MYTIDFETEAIDGNPLLNPPKPVGVAIHKPGELTTYTDDWSLLERVWNSGEPLLFHNAPFDLSVAQAHLGLQPPSWEKVHDTLYLVFLANPYAPTLALKKQAEALLGLPPDEQDELTSWILANVPGATKKNAGAFISKAPPQLVRPYAIGDVTRTRELFDKLYPEQPREAYDRERELSPILVEGTRRGIRIARSLLENDIEVYEMAMQEVTDRLFQRLGECNLDSGQELADALDRAGLVTEWKYTPTGRRSTSKENLLNAISDRDVYDLLAYRSSLSTCLGTFMLPWHSLSEQDGRVHPDWNQVRNNEDHTQRGTRTGRLSSSRPNFQNVPNEFDQTIPAGLPPLPLMRRYCLPEEGHRWLKRDFSSQEIRILAHFEDGAIMQSYQANPDFDPHAEAMQMIEAATGIGYARKSVKITAFSIVYGSGVNGLSSQLGRPPAEASKLKDAYLRAFPGVKKLASQCSSRGYAGGAIRTWGGRAYYTEPPKIIRGRKVDFSYKLLNYLIQGSAADQTKQCIIDWYNAKGPDDVFLATVHDEINISAPIDSQEQAMTTLRHAMNQDLFDVPFRSEGFAGDNWLELEEVE
jgi:DNA polymerase-1